MVTENKVETPTKEEYETLKSQFDELDGKHKASTSEGQRLHHEIEFLKDPGTFEKLYQTNRNFAIDIAKKYEYDDVEEFREAVKTMKPMTPGKKEEKDSDEAIEDKILSRLEEKENAKKAEAVVQEFLEERTIDLESDFGKDVMAEYKELVGSRKLDPDKAKKYIVIAYREAKGSSKHAEEHEKKLDQLRSVGMGARNTKVYTDEKKVGPAFNQSFTFKEAYSKK